LNYSAPGRRACGSGEIVYVTLCERVHKRQMDMGVEKHNMPRVAGPSI
jgi:hypothetical protein